MSGIVFLATRRLDEIRAFYTGTLGCEVWLDQADCVILKHGNLLLGFCAREHADPGGVITFFYPDRAEVDEMYRVLGARATGAPAANEKYAIYQFFARDPEGRMLEFQSFDHRLEPYLDGVELLLSRRSIRAFRPDAVPPERLDRLFELCRYAPTARNSQSYYYRPIHDRTLLDWLADVRDWKSAPIGAAPMAVAVCADPERSGRHIQDGCIAAYHLLLAARCLGLGTCWIADLDRDTVKERLGIPASHYVATITPVGFPQEVAVCAPERRERAWFVRT